MTPQELSEHPSFRGTDDHRQCATCGVPAFIHLVERQVKWLCPKCGGGIMLNTIHVHDITTICRVIGCDKDPVINAIEMLRQEEYEGRAFAELNDFGEGDIFLDSYIGRQIRHLDAAEAASINKFSCVLVPLRRNHYKEGKRRTVVIEEARVFTVMRTMETEDGDSFSITVEIQAPTRLLNALVVDREGCLR